MGRLIPTILCVDDNPDALESLRVILRREGYQVVTTQSKTSGIIKARSGVFDLFILAIELPDGSGIELCKEIRTFDKQTPIVFYSVDGVPFHLEGAIKAGAQAYLKQPVHPTVLNETVARFLHHPR
jgi:DNA-binding response OmpR family regulator